jgi:hypothetical protein
LMSILTSPKYRKSERPKENLATPDVPTSGLSA